MRNVLIVEDEEHLADGLRFNLEAEGYSVEVTGEGEEALELLLRERQRFDAVVLDVMLPGMSGFEVVRRLRAEGQFVPVLMLTARGRAEDILQGFDGGADDYLPKPFELKILLARLHGLLRRREWLRSHAPAAAAARDGNKISFAGRTIDFERLEVQAEGETHQLTTMECDLLRYLIENQGKPVSRKSILENVWGLHEDTDTRAIDNFIVRLRRYLEPNPARPQFLLTVRGVGYKLVIAPE